MLPRRHPRPAGEGPRHLTFGALVSLPADVVSPGEHEQLAVYVVDVDRLRALNAALGIRAGDHLIDVFGRRIGGWAGRGAFVARLDGGAFVAVVPGPADISELGRRAEVLRSALCRPVAFDTSVVSRTVSIGAASGRPRTGLIADLVLQADRAVGVAKRSGGDTVCTADVSVDGHELRRAQLELAVHEALQTGAGLLLHFQPEVDLRTGELLAVEALARWHHPERGLLSAEAFIEIAEESGAIPQLGEWALRAACAQRAAWAAQHDALNVTVRVNVSPTQLVDGRLPALLSALMAEYQLSGDQLGIELTEATRPPQPERMVEALTAIRNLGIEVAIDDFGVGHSSLARLKAFPFDALKVDRQFVAGLADNPVDRIIIEEVLRLGELLGVVVIAEGVEEATGAATLLRLGCFRAQGNWIMPAVPPDELVSALSTGRLELPSLPD